MPIKPTATGQATEPVLVKQLNHILSVISDSRIFFTGFVDHSVTCVLLHTGATVSALRESTWENSGHVPKFKPVEVTLTTAKGNELTVLGETEVRFHIRRIDCSLPVMTARALSHNCTLGSTFFSTLGVKFTVERSLCGGRR